MSVPILSLGTDARTQQRAINEQAHVLAQFGGVLDSQADAIRGLGENQRILWGELRAAIDDCREHRRGLTFWQRLRWLVRGA